MNRNILLGLAFVPILLCAQEKYKVRSIAWERLEVTAALDATPEAEAFEIVKPYKHSVDSVMMPFLGVSRTAMSAGRPESLLGNWAADVMVETSTATGLERADLGVVNVGGLRNNMPEGNVRRGDVMLISPFQNNVVVTEMKGSDLQQLMCDIAAVHGEAVSSSVRLVITKDGKLVSATIGGQPIDPMRTYRLATIDYLLDGNDKLYSMKRHGKVYPMNMLSRDAMSEYIIKTKVIDSKLEGRIVVQ
ncbi:MAG: 5'-nucleotidase C-terminal domain-containing protein [Bacteroidaceae bacterium]|nr:5'-nucleotidase C-terminal domain-containing protein [Bacteroidaceae bacterium]MBQ3957473.1 5'-nucleotidase C-terminal domain-containing protein [Bacteroidaceae bacterium]MBQ4003405.1 5'-nucleotidase C-terminal domain-containing protein [Bacteroidaceae bacterium]